jgi:crossover junction endodeoxyribonuclease RuvC
VPDRVPTSSRLDELTARARRVVAVGDPPVRSAAGGGHAATAGVESGSPVVPHESAAGGGGGDEALVIGVDPGTATTGYGIVRRASPDADQFEAVDYGVIETPAGQPMPERLATLHGKLRAILCEHRPTQAAVELLFFGKNATTAMTVGQARGVVLMALGEARIPVAEYKPMEVKKATAGFGGAEKTQMQRMVQMLLGLPEIPRPDDAADGLALAITHLRLARLRALGIR